MTDASTFLTIKARLPELDAAQQAATGLVSNPQHDAEKC